MKTRLIATVGAACVLLTACALLRHSPEREADFARFRYGLRGDASAGVVQAFNLGGRTYLQFVDLERARPVLHDGGGHELSYQSLGQYAVLPGAVDSVAVSTSTGRTLVYALDRPAAASAPPMAGSDPASFAQPLQPAAALPIATATTAAAARDSAAASFRSTLTFPPGKWAVESLTLAQRDELDRVAASLRRDAARELRVVGYTDPIGADVENVRLSEKRAGAVANIFTTAGVPNVVAIGRGPRDQVNDCSRVRNARALERCHAASRRVVIERVL